jgi:hypothetical protein
MAQAHPKISFFAGETLFSAPSPGLMSTPRKGKKGSGRRSPSPRASPHSDSSNPSSEASVMPRQLQISELVDAGSSFDEARVLISPNALTTLALRSGDLVLLEWSSADKDSSSSSAISMISNSVSHSVAPVMSIVLTAFPSTNSAAHRVGLHSSVLSCISPPCRFGPNTFPFTY